MLIIFRTRQRRGAVLDGKQLAAPFFESYSVVAAAMDRDHLALQVLPVLEAQRRLRRRDQPLIDDIQRLAKVQRVYPLRRRGQAKQQAFAAFVHDLRAAPRIGTDHQIQPRFGRQQTGDAGNGRSDRQRLAVGVGLGGDQQRDIGDGSLAMAAGASASAGNASASASAAARPVQRGAVEILVLPEISCINSMQSPILIWSAFPKFPRRIVSEAGIGNQAKKRLFADQPVSECQT